MSSYAESKSSNGSMIFWWVIILLAGMVIYGAVVPQGAVQDFLNGKSSSLNDDHDQKCKSCGTTYDVSGGYCATCRLNHRKEAGRAKH